MEVKSLYVGLENPWPHDLALGDLVVDYDYTHIGQTVFVHRHLKPGTFETSKGYKLRLIGYHRISAHWSKTMMMKNYPHLRPWIKTSWPCPVGRYAHGEYVLDVVFGSNALDPTDVKYLEQRRAPFNPEWTDAEKREWFLGGYGYWTGWTYDLRSSVLADLVMEAVSSIPPEERTLQRVVRHMVSISSEANSSKGLLYGMWDPKRFSEGREPGFWKSTHQILAHRFMTGEPAKFAQCWIFSEVLVSVFRFLGIASRTVFVENARIDRGCDGGVDIGLAVMKSDDGEIQVKEYEGYDVWHNIEEAVSSLGHYVNDVVSKSDSIPEPDHRENPRPKEGCEEVDLRSFVRGDDSIWNFHVFPEVYLYHREFLHEKDVRHSPREKDVSHLSHGWFCVDGCPVEITTSDDTYAGKKVLGPCSVEAIKSGTIMDHDFKYFTSTVNGLYRFWKNQKISMSDGREIEVVYPHNIVYGCLTGSEDDKRQVKMYVRNPELSSGPYRNIKLSVLSSYRPSREIAFEIHHRNHPILFKLNKSRSLSFVIRHEITTPHFVQICCLNSTGGIISCDRQIVKSWPGIIMAPISEMTTKFSVVIADLTTRNWWTQIV